MAAIAPPSELGGRPTSELPGSFKPCRTYPPTRLTSQLPGSLSHRRSIMKWPRQWQWQWQVRPMTLNVARLTKWGQRQMMAVTHCGHATVLSCLPECSPVVLDELQEATLPTTNLVSKPKTQTSSLPPRTQCPPPPAPPHSLTQQEQIIWLPVMQVLTCQASGLQDAGHKGTQNISAHCIANHLSELLISDPITVLEDCGSGQALEPQSFLEC